MYSVMICCLLSCKSTAQNQNIYLGSGNEIQKISVNKVNDSEVIINGSRVTKKLSRIVI